MDQEQATTIPPQTEAAVPSAPQLPAGETAPRKARTWPMIVGGVVLLAVLVGVIILLLSIQADSVGKIRDIFIIFMALESLIIGIVLVILIVQLAVLTNLLQNEIKPILKTTNETVQTLKGTTTFLSNNLSEPVIKLNEYLAGLKKLLDILFPSKR